MHVTCPNCSTKYNLPEEAFKPGGKARCTVCKHVFPLEKELLPPPPQEEDDDLSDLLGDDSDSLPLDGSKKKKKKKKKGGKLSLFFAIFFVVFAVSGAGVYILLPELITETLGISVEENAKEQGGASEENPTDQVKLMTLRNVRQYYFANEKTGQLFVVEGKVVNNFTTPKDLVKVGISLFDANGQVLTSKQQLCGSTASLFQLQVLGQQELEEALNNKIEILTNNTNIQPGGEVSFMIVFYNAPKAVKEFSVEVVEAKEPPKDPQS